jgi:m7GpppX diphosphatase
MKFQKLKKIDLRNETKKYFESFVNFNKANLYYGYYGNTQDFLCILLSVKEIPEELELDNDLENDLKIKHHGTEHEYDAGLLDKILSQYEKISDKCSEIVSQNIYIRFPVSVELIDWLKADIEIFTETYQMYKKISLPYINSIYEKNIKWINELIYNNSEESIVLFRNQDMVLCKDIVWKDNNINQFYILGIPTKKIKTIRDLTSNDIPLLKSIRDKAIDIAEKLGINKNKLYMFFHYHPSYYQLHLHICVTEHEALETKYLRNYWLYDVITKLESTSDYWKKSTLQFELLSNTKLSKLLKE